MFRTQASGSGLLSIALGAGLIGSAFGQEPNSTNAAFAQPLPPEADASTEVATISLPVAAPATNTPAAAKPRGNPLIEEVIVTAQKRAENIKDVPIAIQAFTPEKMEALQIEDVGDLPKVTPGLTITDQLGFSTSFLRGVGADSFLLADPLVVTYVDDVYFPFSLGSLQDFGAVESIEVLKGPQGTLFGRNALGGAIRINTRKPSFERVMAATTFEMGSSDSRKIKYFASAPLTDSFALGVSGVDKSEDPYIHGTYGLNPPQPLYKNKQSGYRVKLRWAPAEWTEANVSYYEYKQSGAPAFITNSIPHGLGSVLPPQDPRAGAIDGDPKFSGNAKTWFGSVVFNTSIFDVKLLGSTQEVAFGHLIDFDMTPLTIANFDDKTVDGGPGARSDSTTGEFQILSNDDSPASDWLEWIIGAYYFKSKAGFGPAHLWVSGANLDTGEVLGVAGPDSLFAVLNRILGPAGVQGQVGIEFYARLGTESMAYFSQATAEITDTVSLTLGARYQDEKRWVVRSSAAVGTAGGFVPYIMIDESSNDRYTDTSKNLDPKAVLSFKPDWDWLGTKPLLYASASTATTSATFNPLNILDLPERIKGTKITAYEAGYKTVFLNGAIDLNAAVFHYDIKNPQVQTIALLAGGAVRLENAGGQRIKGGELEATILPFPTSNPGMVAAVSGTYIDGIFTDYKNASAFGQEDGGDKSGIYSNNNDFSGNRIVKTPKYNATAALNQVMTFGLHEVNVGIDYYYNDGVKFSASDNSKYAQGPYDLWGAHVGYAYEPWGIKIAANARNIFDEDYLAAQFTTDFGVGNVPAPLSTYSLSISWEF